MAGAVVGPPERVKRSGPPPRRTRLERGSAPLKRSQGPKRGGGLSRGKRRKTDSGLAEAWIAGVRDRPCGVCGATKRQRVTVRGHHVVRQQVLRRIAKATHRRTGEDYFTVEQRLLWDRRNLMPICDPCHEAHHPPARSRRITRAEVRRAAPQVEQFARELGREAVNDLDREYPESPTTRALAGAGGAG